MIPYVPIAAGLTIVLGALLVVRQRRRRASHARRREGGGTRDAGLPEKLASRSILTRNAVERSIAGGAPPTPWMLRREDRDAIAEIESYFARAIPNPDDRPFIEESLGFGGPQLELKVPIISSKRAVAVIFRSWDPTANVLESNLYFAGRVNSRLAAIASKAGFERTVFSDRHATVFRNQRGAAQQRSA